MCKFSEDVKYKTKIHLCGLKKEKQEHNTAALHHASRTLSVSPTNIQLTLGQKSHILV